MAFCPGIRRPEGETLDRNHRQVIDIFPTNHESLRTPLTQFAYSSAGTVKGVVKSATLNIGVIGRNYVMLKVLHAGPPDARAEGLDCVSLPSPVTFSRLSLLR